MEEFGQAIRQMGTHLDDWQVRRLFKKLAGKSFCLLCRRTPKFVREQEFIEWWIRTHDTTKEKLGDVLQLLVEGESWVWGGVEPGFSWHAGGGGLQQLLRAKPRLEHRQRPRKQRWPLQPNLAFGSWKGSVRGSLDVGS